MENERIFIGYRTNGKPQIKTATTQEEAKRIIDELQNQDYADTDIMEVIDPNKTSER